MSTWKKLRKASGLSFEDISKGAKVPVNTLKNIESRIDKKKLNPNYVSKLSEFYSKQRGCINFDTEYLTLMKEAGYEIPQKYEDTGEKVKLSTLENKVIQGYNGTIEEKEFIRLILFVMKNKKELLEIFEDRENFDYYLWHKEEIMKWIEQS
jgi:transcriptional regulator with XRE-family HTH domain